MNIETNSILVDTNQTSKNITQPRLSLQPQQDSVSFSSREKIVGKEEKKGLSTGAKWGIGLGLTALASVGIYAISKGKAKSKGEHKQFWDNIKEVQLEKNLNFVEFKDKEEALKFAKEKLKLENIDKDMPLEALNDIIDFFINISNKNNGKICIPSKITQKSTEDFIASVSAFGLKESFGNLTINKNLYDNKWLDNLLEKKFMKDGKPFLEFVNGEQKSFYINNDLYLAFDDSNLLIKYYSKQPLTIKEKQNLVLSSNLLYNEIDMVKRAPLNLLKRLKKEHADVLSKNNLDFDINEISKKTFEEQQNFTQNLLKELSNAKGSYILKIPERSIKETLYHEYGHLVDNLINKNEYKSAKYWLEHTQTLPRLQKSVELKTINKLPDFFNRNEQEIVAEVSLYSQTGIGEFVAETYAGLMSGKKYSDDVMALYKKYNGPLPNGFK